MVIYWWKCSMSKKMQQCVGSALNLALVTGVLQCMCV